MTRPGFIGRFAHIREHRDSSDIEKSHEAQESHKKAHPYTPPTAEQLKANKERSAAFLAKENARRAQLKAIRNKQN